MMTTTRPDIRPAAAADIGDVRRLLASAGLPFEDLRDDRVIDSFLVVRDGDGELVASGGVERYGSDGLLRSLAVDERVRGRGLGLAVTQALEAHAIQSGITTLYLLTMTAADFFRRLGYAPFDRKAVPSTVAQSAEFASLCPASAVCLKKKLE